METIFSKIISREIPAKIVWENDNCIAFEDINKKAPVHVLIIPKQYLRNVNDLTPDNKGIMADLMYGASEVARTLNVQNAYRLVINNGEGAGQSVFHLHVHLLAGKTMGWNPA